VSSLAVHHLDGDQKQSLFRDLAAMIAPGGVSTAERNRTAGAV
jgi:phosphoribosylformylglycinamidine (FGAM) synthase-like amidotransferase family enzyme